VDNPTPAVYNRKKLVDSVWVSAHAHLKRPLTRCYHHLTSNSSKGAARIGRDRKQCAWWLRW
jgi:hypothetical protein